jgi:hypothetical protein
MLRAEPANWLTRDYKLLRGDLCFAQLGFAWHGTRGEVIVDREVFEVGREGFMSGQFTLSRRGKVHASATKPSALQRRFEVSHEGREYELEARSWFDRKFVLRENGCEIGAIRTVQLLSRKAVIDLPPDMPVEVQVFVTWLVLFLWKRQNEGG